MTEDIYIIEGVRQHGGNILLYHGKVRGGAVNPGHWSGYWEDGLNLHLYPDGEYYNVEMRAEPGKPPLINYPDNVRKHVGEFFDNPKKFYEKYVP